MVFINVYRYTFLMYQKVGASSRFLLLQNEIGKHQSTFLKTKAI